MAKDERLHNLIIAIEEERKHEQEFFNKLLTSRSLQQRLDSGYLWYPVDLIKRKYSIGDYISLSFERDESIKDTPHKLKVGVGVRVFSLSEDSFVYPGVISFLRRNKVTVLLYNENAMHDHRLQHEKIGVEVTYDERPYKIMTNALKDVIKNNSPAFLSLKSILLEGKSRFTSEVPLKIDYLENRLNDSQIDAIKKVGSTPDVGVIHGPPGTGKTTTLVQLIKQILKTEKQILVCAPSNNAVDIIASLCYKDQMKVLRVGNISRIDDDILHLTLEEKIKSHPEWKRIKKVKIQAEEAKNKATQFKRSFGSQEREDRKHYYNEAKELRQWAYELEDRLTNQLINEAQVICSTLIGASYKNVDQLKFNTVIIDEASQALEPACWNVILKANRVIFAGDHKQLSPVVKADKAKDLGLQSTILDRMMPIAKHQKMLLIQYRMNDSILGFSNEKYYDGQLVSDASVKSQTLHNDNYPLVMIDTSGCGFDEQMNEKSRSYANPDEYLILREYLLTQKEVQLGSSIGIIAPYAEQVRHIKQTVMDDETLVGLDIEVDTVDGFQGGEKDIIYISTVRSNSMGIIGFLADQRRLNVAMTRARKKLVIVGDFATLSSHKVFSDLATHIENHGQYKSAWEFLV